MINLRDGNEIEDARLDRLVFFDERSREYPIRSLLEAKPLRSYTWSCHECFDQGREGACVGYALAHELVARPAVVTGITNKFIREEIYWEAQKIDPWPGGSYPGASPRYEGTAVLSGIKTLHKKGYFDSYRWAFEINDTLLGLGHNGPSVLGIVWYDHMYMPDEKGFIKPSGKIVGGHAILARAINVKEEYVTLRNSWGNSWGINGDCYIRFSDLDRLLKEDGESAFLLKRKSKV